MAGSRDHSTAHVNVEVKPEGYAVATIRREPVNSMNLELWSQLLQVLEALEKDSAVRGVLWQSGLQRDVFTAGNDLKELHAPSTTQQRHAEFWIKQTTFLARLRRTPLISIAAIRGACPAGGCCMVLCCDIRIITEQGSMGLNEVALGIPVPEYWSQLMARTIGAGNADKLLQFAKMVSPADAKALGLVDEVVSKERLAQVATATMTQLLKLPDWGRQITKERLHGDFARAWEVQGPLEAAEAWAMLASPPVTSAIGGSLQRLTGKKAKAKL